jgi:hypothetical protein
MTTSGRRHKIGSADGKTVSSERLKKQWARFTLRYPLSVSFLQNHTAPILFFKFPKKIKTGIRVCFQKISYFKIFYP